MIREREDQGSGAAYPRAEAEIFSHDAAVTVAPKTLPEVRAGELARALELRRLGSAYVGACPACGYRGFQIQERDGKTLFHCHGGGCEQSRVIDVLRKAGLWGLQPASVGLSPHHWCRDLSNDTGRGAELARDLWRRSRPAEGSPVETYLRARGYAGLIPPALRYLPNARHKETGTSSAAMIAAVTRYPANRIIAVHRTFIRADGTGKARVEPNKKTLGPVSGGAVRLAKAGPVVAISEGIETGLSILVATRIPTWAALSAGGIKALVLPPLPLASEVTIAADADPVGIAAAHDAAQRWHHEGRTVRIACPPEPGTDFNDLLRVEGLAGLATLAVRAA